MIRAGGIGGGGEGRRNGSPFGSCPSLKNLLTAKGRGPRGEGGGDETVEKEIVLTREASGEGCSKLQGRGSLLVGRGRQGGIGEVWEKKNSIGKIHPWRGTYGGRWRGKNGNKRANALLSSTRKPAVSTGGLAGRTGAFSLAGRGSEDVTSPRRTTLPAKRH